MAEKLVQLKKKGGGGSGNTFSYLIMNGAVGSKYGTFTAGSEIPTLTFTAENNCVITANQGGAGGFGNYIGARIYINNVLMGTTQATPYPTPISANASAGDEVSCRTYSHAQPGNIGAGIEVTISY